LNLALPARRKPHFPFRHKAAGHKHLYPLPVPWIVSHDFFPASLKFVISFFHDDIRL